MGAVLLFGDSNATNVQKFANFLDDILECTLVPVRNRSVDLLKEFKKAMHDFQVGCCMGFYRDFKILVCLYKFIQERIARIFRKFRIW